MQSRETSKDRALSFDAALFDLDGVVTRTASLHAAAWKQLFDDYLKKRAARGGPPFKEFDAEQDYKLYVDGKPRGKGIASFLQSRGIELPEGDPGDGPDRETIYSLGDIKNANFNRMLREQGAEVFESTVSLIREMKAAGIKVGIVSSSKNCKPILERAGLLDLFEIRVDGVNSIAMKLNGKPEPDIFLKGAELLGVGRSKTVVVEDAVSGVAAGRAGGFGLVLGIDRGGNRINLLENGADMVVDDLQFISLDQINAHFANREHVRPAAPGRLREVQNFLERLVRFIRSRR
ncbi:MAG: beta-phosphoglucomutase family hydrolase [Elusimicrobiota bacterium]